MQLHLRSLILRFGLGAAALGLAIGGGATAFAHGNQGNAGHDGHTQVSNGHANLRHTPDGTVALSWDPGSKDLTVDISMTGLAPNSTHPAQIRSGRCGNLGATVDALTGVSADAHGKGTSHTVVHNVAGGIPRHGWALTVQNTAGNANLACGNIDGPQHQKRHTTRHGAAQMTAQKAHAKLGPAKGANQNANGEAHLQLDGGKLTTKLNVDGLSQGTHAALIGQGSCSALGAKAFDLAALTANAGGHGKSETTIPNVSSIPNTGWYVAVFRGADASGDMVACGNVRVGNHD